MVEQNGVGVAYAVPDQAEMEADQRKGVKSLGPLESQLMEALWSAAGLSVQDVIDRLGSAHNYKTVMTVLNRLVQKGLLERQLDGRAYRYHASQGRDEFLRSAADEVVHQYMESFGGNATEYLADAVDAVAPRPARAAFEPARAAFEPARAAFEPPGAAFEPPRAAFEPPRAAFEDVSPSPHVHEPAPRQVPIVAIVLTALALQIVTFFLARRGVR